MDLNFYKYHGAGNDFVLIDNRYNQYSFLKNSPEIIKNICDRHFGIGADGLMLLNSNEKSAFSMQYFNSDGNEGTMCGNGGRCIAWFANQLKIVGKEFQFDAIDGMHEAIIIKKNKDLAIIKLKMQDVVEVEEYENHFVMDTGSPHYVKFVSNLDELDVFAEGKKIRNSMQYHEEGINVNFVERKEDFLFVRTYERGVENETLACGTGVTASAIANNLDIHQVDNPTFIKTMGGNLKVFFKKKKDSFFTDIWLQGPAVKVFEGIYEI